MAQTRSRIPGNHSFSNKWREKPSSCQCLASDSFGSTGHAPGASWSTRSGEEEQNQRTPGATKKTGPRAHVLCVYSLSSLSASTQLQRDHWKSGPRWAPLNRNNPCVLVSSLTHVPQPGAQSDSAHPEMTCTNSFLHSHTLSKRKTLA